LAHAQAALTLGQIRPENELERAFLAAFNDPAQRPGFRRELLSAQVALALANSAPDSPPRMQALPGNGPSVGLIYSSASRLSGVLGPAAPRVVLSGRAALTRLAGQHVAFNYRLAPMLTLEPSDVAEYLA
jgi:hypothetical protein